MQETLTGISDHVSLFLTGYGLSVIGAVVMLIVGWTAAGWLAGATARSLARVRRVDETLRGFFASLVRYLVIAITVIAVLEQFGFETTSLVAVLGAAGLAVGLALQGTLSNLAAGVMLLFFRPFKVGDYIEAGGLAGTVKEMSLFMTEFATPDNVKILAPNAQLWGTPIKNYSANQTRRLDFTMSIAYGDDIDRAIEVALAQFRDDSRIMADPEPMAAVASLGENAVDLTIRVWCAASDYWSLKWEKTKALKQAFDSAGLTVPFPQRDVWIRREHPAA